MMTLDQIELFVRQAELRHCDAVEYEEDGCVLRLRFHHDPAESDGARRPEVISTASSYIRAPSAGVFRRSHPLRTDFMVPEGTNSLDGRIVGFLQIGPLLRPIIAGAGVVGACMVEDGALVGFGEALFQFRPDDA